VASQPTGIVVGREALPEVVGVLEAQELSEVHHNQPKHHPCMQPPSVSRCQDQEKDTLPPPNTDSRWRRDRKLNGFITVGKGVFTPPGPVTWRRQGCSKTGDPPPRFRARRPPTSHSLWPRPPLEGPVRTIGGGSWATSSLEVPWLWL
jgi:hypothetical protein